MTLATIGRAVGTLNRKQNGAVGAVDSGPPPLQRRQTPTRDPVSSRGRSPSPAPPTTNHCAPMASTPKSPSRSSRRPTTRSLASVSPKAAASSAGGTPSTRFAGAGKSKPSAP